MCTLGITTFTGWNVGWNTPLKKNEPRALDPQLMLRAYARGIFPMAEKATDRGLVLGSILICVVFFQWKSFTYPAACGGFCVE